MKNLTKHKNWLREEITPPLLRRTGERVNRLRRDWGRDFGLQTLDRDKAWAFWRNTHKAYWRGRVEKILRMGSRVTCEVRGT